MDYKIIHETKYSYSNAVNLCYNEARLTPRSFVHQHCSKSQFVVDPEPGAGFRKRQDFFGNTVYYFTIQQPHRELTVTVTSHVQVSGREMQLDFMETRPTHRSSGGDFQAEHLAWEEVRQRIQTDMDPEILELRQYVLDSPMIPTMPELRTYAERSFPKERPLLEAVEELTARLYADFTYDPNFTTIATPLAEVIQHRRGVCQDFAHLGIGCLRTLGLAARYVSGYIETEPPPDQERLAGADASHAWLSVYLPQLGWVDFDPTNNQIPADQHITIAWGRDYSDVTPLKGVVFGSGTHELSVSVDCQRVLS